MKIVVVGLNHKTAPIDIRERLAFDSEQTLRALRELKNRFCEAEFVLLSTCNRVELYCASKRMGGIMAGEIAKFLSEFHNVALEEFEDFLYVHNEEDAVKHLLTVASSLDSMVVGEAQIIGQVKESYRLACAAKSTGKVLNRLFHCAFATSKKIHTITSLSSGRVSIAGVAVELAMQLFADISSAKVVVIGVGEMGELLVRHLLHAGCKNITIVNRSLQRGLTMARRYDVTAREWGDLKEQLIDANIAIASASAQDYLFKKDTLKKIMDSRREGTLLVIDIAVPRNFEPSINEIENVYLYSVDELSEVAEQNRKDREEDITKGMQVICENVTEFIDWFRAREIGPMIGQMKDKFARISENELERFFVGARQEASCREVMEVMVNRIVNKLLHCVIKNINIVAKKHSPTEAAKLVDSIVRQAGEIPVGLNNERMTAKEPEAARNNDVLNAVISAISEGLIFVNCDGDVAICNPAAKLWKKDRDINNNDHSLDDFPQTLAEHIEGLLADGDKASSVTEEIKFNTETPERCYIEAKSCPVVGINGKRLGYVIIGQDLTDHRKLEKDLREQTEEVTAINEMLKMTRIEMVQREKMVAIGQMATGIAHEIGNPLASLSSVAQYLGRKLSTHEEKEHLLVIQYQVNRISNILKRMLSLSRPARDEYKWTDISSLIDDTLSLVRFDKRMRSITIKNITSPDLPIVWLDPQHLEQALLNIFLNALDAMNAKQDKQEHILEITREFKDGMIEIRISDTGIGMSPEVCRRAFESFFTTKEIGKGTGLGLFISYNLVAEIDGTIAMESELGKGTTVIIRVPVRPKKHLVGTDDAKGDFLNSVKAVKEGDG